MKSFEFLSFRKIDYDTVQHFGDVDVLLKTTIRGKTEVIGDVAIEFFEF